MGHPTVSDIERYGRRDMGLLKRMLTWIHMGKCRRCASILEKLEEDDRLLGEVRTAVMKQADPEISESDSAFVSLRKALGEEGRQST